MKEKISFTCDPNSKSDADFYITYKRELWNWNDLGYYISYLIYATPKITPNKKEVLLGDIGIYNPHQEWAKHDCLENSLRESGNYSLFHELPESFASRIFEKEATMLWMLLDSEQRKEFIIAMHLILDKDSLYQNNIIATKNPLFRDGIDEASEKYLDLVKELMLSPIDFRWTIGHKSQLMDCYGQLLMDSYGNLFENKEGL